MDERSNHDEAIELLLELGLKEYEARSFVALTQLQDGTAKQISEISEVPRTRVYDAIKVLEDRGLVEVHHSNPQRFRAVSIDEAADILEREFVTRTDSLRDTLHRVTPATVDGEEEVTHEVWALSGDTAISTRTRQLIGEAQSEVLMVVGARGIVDAELVESLREAQREGVDLVIGTIDEDVKGRVQESLPGAEIYVSGLEWLRSAISADDHTEISRLLLVDRETILVSTFHQDDYRDRVDERAVFGRGFDNGVVVVMRRLMATGRLPANEPESETA